MLKAEPRARNSLPPVWDTTWNLHTGARYSFDQGSEGRDDNIPITGGGEGPAPQIRLLGLPPTQPIPVGTLHILWPLPTSFLSHPFLPSGYTLGHKANLEASSQRNAHQMGPC